MSMETDIAKLLKYYSEISELELRNYARENNIEPDILLTIIKNAQDSGYNDSNNDIKLTSEGVMDINDLIKRLRAENNAIKSQVESTKWLLTILISVFGIITPLLFTMHSRYIDSKFDAFNTNVNSKFELIQQQLDSQKEINSLQIQRDVSQEFLKQKK